MLATFWSDCARWWDGLPSSFVFLLALPFAVAAIGLLAHWRRTRGPQR